jgi:uncharacterized membrane protein YdjX (TVP38/TMEM64 family)
MLVAATYAIALLLLDANLFLHYAGVLQQFGYLGVFVAGFFYAYEITAAPAAVLLLLMAKGQNIFYAAIAGGLGALISDIVIFFLVRTTMLDEIRRISKTGIGRFIEREERLLFGKFKKYALYVFAAFMIASPLPTEIGVSILATVRGLTPKKFILLAYVLHTVGIFAILWIGAIF